MEGKGGNWTRETEGVLGLVPIKRNRTNNTTYR